MSMLAERKRKQKWSLNPRGKDWSEDKNKLGQKLMEKMGWKNGKGLGLKEDGMLEHIKISYKNDSKGMGFMEQTEQWTEHQDNFSKLLENLKGDMDSECDIKEKVSLEEKSMKSRARVHYHKFTRGKDLSRYSDKDLANILGKKSLKDKPKETEEEPIKNYKDNENETNKSFGVETKKGGSMADYFKKKLPNFSMSNNGYNIGLNGVLQTSTRADSDTELDRPSFGFGFNTAEAQHDVSNSTTVESIAEEVNASKKKKKAKTLKDSFVSYISEKKDDNVDEIANDLSEVQQQKHKKKKEKEVDKKSKFISYIQEENATEEESGKFNKKKRKNDNTKEDMEAEPKKRKLEPQQSDNKKSKKKKQCIDLGISNPAFDPMSRNLIVEKHVLQPINEDATDISHAEEELIVSETTPCEEIVKKTKRSKKKNKLNGCINPNADINLDAEINLDDENEAPLEHSNNVYEIKETAKKRKKRKGRKQEEDNYAIDNPCFDPKANTQTEENGESNDNNFEVQRKKKKNKEQQEKEVDDSNKSETCQNYGEIQCDLMLNVCTITPAITPKIEGSKRSPPKRRKSVRFSDVHQERIIPNNDDLRTMSVDQNKMDLYDINTKVIENGLKEQAKKDGKNGIVNTGFDMRSIDKISFYEKSHVIKNGIENVAFNENSIQIEESMIGIKKKLDNYQAEIENDINEAKITTTNDKIKEDERHVGIVASNREEHENTREGVLLAFKKASFGKEPKYVAAQMGPKKSYKNLIKGDVILKFRNTNLDKIDGYGNALKKNKNKID